MIVVICVDEKRGILFNKRRQSQDRIVRERILAIAEKSNLWMNSYSKKQFPQANISVSEDYLKLAGPGEFCFVENQSLLPYKEKIEKVILFCWNCVYPADFWLDFHPADFGWVLSASEEFSGFSHEKITQETYIPGNK